MQSLLQFQLNIGLDLNINLLLFVAPPCEFSSRLFFMARWVIRNGNSRCFVDFWSITEVHRRCSLLLQSVIDVFIFEKTWHKHNLLIKFGNWRMFSSISSHSFLKNTSWLYIDISLLAVNVI